MPWDNPAAGAARRATRGTDVGISPGPSQHPRGRPCSPPPVRCSLSPSQLQEGETEARGSPPHPVHLAGTQASRLGPGITPGPRPSPSTGNRLTHNHSTTARPPTPTLPSLTESTEPPHGCYRRARLTPLRHGSGAGPVPPGVPRCPVCPHCGGVGGGVGTKPDPAPPPSSVPAWGKAHPRVPPPAPRRCQPPHRSSGLQGLDPVAGVLAGGGGEGGAGLELPTTTTSSTESPVLTWAGGGRAAGAGRILPGGCRNRNTEGGGGGGPEPLGSAPCTVEDRSRLAPVARWGTGTTPPRPEHGQNWSPCPGIAVAGRLLSRREQGGGSPQGCACSPPRQPQPTGSAHPGQGYPQVRHYPPGGPWAPPHPGISLIHTPPSTTLPSAPGEP